MMIPDCDTQENDKAQELSRHAGDVSCPLRCGRGCGMKDERDWQKPTIIAIGFIYIALDLRVTN